ncbi:hypothetical protein D3C86_1779880 [compost metagenome]
MLLAPLASAFTVLLATTAALLAPEASILTVLAEKSRPLNDDAPETSPVSTSPSPVSVSDEAPDRSTATFGEARLMVTCDAPETSISMFFTPLKRATLALEAPEKSTPSRAGMVMLMSTVFRFLFQPLFL